jgi:hypothetical protein
MTIGESWKAGIIETNFQRARGDESELLYQV